MAGVAIDPKQADAPYWEGLRNGKLLIQKCESCGKRQWPAVFRCGNCGQWDPPWQEVSKSGKIFSWTRTYQKFPGLESFGLPFVSILVELDDADGTRLLGVLAEGNAEVAIGDAVKGEITERTMHGATMPTIIWHR